MASADATWSGRSVRIILEQLRGYTPLMTSLDREFFKKLTRRYGDVSPDDLLKVIVPLHVPMLSLDKTIHKIPGQNHWRASFTAPINEHTRPALTPGVTGKFVSAAHVSGHAPWREICKGRILSVDYSSNIAHGEVYVGSSRKLLEEAVAELDDGDFLEVDQYGASAKVLSALTESTLATELEEEGFEVRRMPEDMARHIARYANYDFEVTKGGVTKKVEVKSIWGTDTRYARLIHSKGKEYETSSCKFATQDFFAVSLFLRTGNIRDFAFARSVSADVAPYGLPCASKFPDYVNQNPLLTVGDGVWFSDLSSVWDLP